jgi:uncharacterized membrane protein YdbT with pleckstrin-like domain
MVDDRAAANPDGTQAGGRTEPERERTLWSGHPSQLENAGSFALSGLAVLAILSGAALLARTLGENAFLEQHSLALLVALGALCLVPIGRAVWHALQVRFLTYEVTSERLRIRHGVLSRVTEELELYRVKDLTLHEPFVYRLLGLSSIHLHSSDRSAPLLVIRAIREGGPLREQMRACVERQRRLRGVRELDV